MHRSVFYKLFAMMFLEFFIWGAWLPLIFGYLPALKFNALEQSLILNAFPVAAILAMFFSNQFADRNFAAEKFLAVSQSNSNSLKQPCFTLQIADFRTRGNHYDP